MSEPLGRDRFSTLPQAEVDATREKWEELTKPLCLSFDTFGGISFDALGGIAQEISKQLEIISEHIPLIQYQIKRLRRHERALKRSRANTQHKRFKHGRQCRTR